MRSQKQKLFIATHKHMTLTMALLDHCKYLQSLRSLQITIFLEEDKTYALRERGKSLICLALIYIHKLLMYFI